jgi:hypothetical protein
LERKGAEVSANRIEQNFDGIVKLAFITEEELAKLREKLAVVEQENRSLREELYGKVQP